MSASIGDTLFKAPQDDYVFLSRPYTSVGHGRLPFEVDLRVLRDGRVGDDRVERVSGRPELAAELLPAYKAYCAKRGLREKSAELMIRCSVRFFKFLDRYEEAAIATGVDPDSVMPRDIHSIQGVVWSAFKDELASGDQQQNGRAHLSYWACRRLFTLAADLKAQRHSDRPTFYLPPNPFPQPNTKGTDPYSEDVVRAMVLAATRHHRNVERRLKRGHTLADAGVDPLELIAEQKKQGLHQGGHSPGKLWKRVWTLENTLHFLRDTASLELSTHDELRERFGVNSTAISTSIRGERFINEWSRFDAVPGDRIAQGLAGTYAWLLPRMEDLIPAFKIIGLRTGWNEATILDMRRSSWFTESPSHPDLAVVMHSRKGRARGRRQYAYSLRHKKGHAYRIIEQVIEWTEPLRRNVLQLLRVIQTELATCSPHDPRFRILNTERKRLVDLQDRVWLYLSQNPVGVSRLKGESRERSVAHSILEQAGITDEDGIPVTWSSRRARDSWATFVWETSGYRLLFARLALGQSDLQSLHRYLTTKAERRRGHAAMWNLTEHIFTEIRAGQGVHPGTLRHLVENGTITEEQRQRLLSGRSRTRHGTHCTDPSDPDPDVDPNHKPGELCSTQACLTPCSRAFATSDSLPWLARSVVRLRRAREITPILEWSTSGWMHELAALEKVLSRFDPRLTTIALDDAERLPSHPLTVPSSVRSKQSD